MATSRKRTTEGSDPGETRLSKGNRLVGMGNLLAGVLFSIAMAELEQARMHKAAFKDFFLDYFGLLP